MEPAMILGVTLLTAGTIFIGCAFCNLDRIDRYFSEDKAQLDTDLETTLDTKLILA